MKLTRLLVLTVCVSGISGGICHAAGTPAQPAQQQVETLFEGLTRIIAEPSKLRDPFLRMVFPKVKVKEVNLENVSPLLKFPLDKYNLLGVIVGNARPRALIRVDGEVFIVKENDKLGSGGGVIKRIKWDGIHVIETGKDVYGRDVPKTKVIKIGKLKEAVSKQLQNRRF